MVASGRPVLYIGLIDGEIPRILSCHNFGFTANIGDSESVVAFICKLKDDSSIANVMGQNARQVFVERFDKIIAFDKWSKVFIDVYNPHNE